MQYLVSVIDDGQAEAAGRDESATAAEDAAIDVLNEQVARYRALPRISVALPIRVASEPPVPCTSAICASGTCTAGCASPRNWRTASITFVMPPRLVGWLLHKPPPSVLNGSLPCGATNAPSETKRPPSPFSQKPRSSIVSSTVMVNES